MAAKNLTKAEEQVMQYLSGDKKAWFLKRCFGTFPRTETSYHTLFPPF